jgi:hypothetical protein
MGVNGVDQGLCGILDDFSFVDGFLINGSGSVVILISDYAAVARFGNEVSAYGHAFRKIEESYHRHSKNQAFNGNVMLSREAQLKLMKSNYFYVMRSEELEYLVPDDAGRIYLDAFQPIL